MASSDKREAASPFGAIRTKKMALENLADRADPSSNDDALAQATNRTPNSQAAPLFDLTAYIVPTADNGIPAPLDFPYVLNLDGFSLGSSLKFEFAGTGGIDQPPVDVNDVKWIVNKAGNPIQVAVAPGELGTTPPAGSRPSRFSSQSTN
jgi:hypothetical protein